MKDVSLYDILIALCVTRVVAGVDEAYVADVKSAVGEHLEFIIGAQLRQVKPLAPPNDGRTGWASHVALNFDVVPHTPAELVHFERLVERHHRYTYSIKLPIKASNHLFVSSVFLNWPFNHLLWFDALQAFNPLIMAKSILFIPFFSWSVSFVCHHPSIIYIIDTNHFPISINFGGTTKSGDWFLCDSMRSVQDAIITITIAAISIAVIIAMRNESDFSRMFLENYPTGITHRNWFQKSSKRPRVLCIPLEYAQYVDYWNSLKLLEDSMDNYFKVTKAIREYQIGKHVIPERDADYQKMTVQITSFPFDFQT